MTNVRTTCTCGHSKLGHRFGRPGQLPGTGYCQAEYCDCRRFKSRLEDIAESVAKDVTPVMRGGLNFFGGNTGRKP